MSLVHCWRGLRWGGYRSSAVRISWARRGRTHCARLFHGVEASRAHQHRRMLPSSRILHKNGTYVGDTLVIGVHHLQDGDRIRIGAFLLTFHRPDRNAPTSTQTAR